MDGNLHLEQFVTAANGITAFAVLQAITFGVTALSSRDLQTLLRNQPKRWIYGPTIARMLLYVLAVVAAWWVESRDLSKTLESHALCLLAGRLLIIVLTSLVLLFYLRAALKDPQQRGRPQAKEPGPGKVAYAAVPCRILSSRCSWRTKAWAAVDWKSSRDSVSSSSTGDSARSM